MQHRTVEQVKDALVQELRKRIPADVSDAEIIATLRMAGVNALGVVDDPRARDARVLWRVPRSLP